MDNLEDNIRIVDGDAKTLRRAKFLCAKRKLQNFAKHIQFRFAIILNGFKF